MKGIKLYKPILLLVVLFIVSIQLINAQSSLQLPPHVSIYNLDVRGYWFIAPKSFIITGLRVPTDAGNGTQNMQVIKINGTAVEHPLEGTNFTTLSYIKDAPNGVIQNVNIPVAAGETIGILGAVGDSVSYSGSVTPYTSSILGQAVTLGRLIYQGNIDNNPAPNYSVETSGPIGRIEFYYTCIIPSADSIIAEQVSPCLFNFNLANDKNANSYKWDFGDGSPIASGSATAHVYSTNGSFVVKATLISDCDSITLLKAVYCTVTGIKNNKTADSTVNLYPNPAANLLNIRSENDVRLKEVAIFNLLGKNVYQSSVQDKHQHIVDISQLPTGIYSVYLQTNKNVLIKKLEVLK